jgi:hypothetical protein
MTYDATTDTGTLSDRNVLCDIRKYRKEPEKKTAIPSGYMTGDEFERRVIERLEQIYKELGLLQQKDLG